MFSSVFHDTSLTSESWSSETSSLFEDDTLRSRHHSNTSSTLEYVVNHVFFPVYHPRHDDHSKTNTHTLTRAVHAAACAFIEHINHDHKPRWLRITKMLENLQTITKSTQPWDEDPLEKSPEEGRKLSLHHDRIPQLDKMTTGDTLVFPVLYDHIRYGIIFRKLDHCILYESFRVSRDVRSYPELAIEIPNSVCDNGDFCSELANSFSGADIDRLTNMLRSFGHTVEPKHIAKHLGPTSIQPARQPGQGSTHDWSRSDLWVLIRVAVQLSLDYPSGLVTYKSFILFFICSLANYAVNTSPPSIVLHSMSAKILRRLKKLGPSVPQWLYDTVSGTCKSLSRTLNQRWQEMHTSQCPSPPWDPLHLGLTNDIQSSLPHVHEYISTSLANRGRDAPRIPFLPNSPLRGLIGDFLSFSDESSHLDDVDITLHDFQLAVSNNIDDWVASVINIDEACEQLWRSLRRYRSHTRARSDTRDPDHHSIMLLTIFELWVALDKLVVRQIPILADYSPELPTDDFRRLLIRDASRVHRFSRAYQYLVARHHRAHSSRSVFSDDFTEDSFPCRYYDSSPQLQHLKASIENELPSEPLHAKVVVFELQRPVSFNAWSSATLLSSVLHIHSSLHLRDKPKAEGDRPVSDILVLKAHTISRRSSHSLYSNPHPERWKSFYYVSNQCSLGHIPEYQLPSGPYTGLQQYLRTTQHTSNEVFAAQGNRRPSLSLHEYIAFAHLRSGGTLQWFNILRELRSKALNIHHQEVYLLIAQATSEVGPFNNTGESLWHQEVQEPPFCRALLDELGSLFVDVGMGSMDGTAMATISLLAGLLASRSSRDILYRAIGLLRRVRRWTFGRVHELLYDVRMSPTNEENLKLLRDMAAVCRSTFDVGSVSCNKVLHSSQDIEAALSCAMIINIATQSLPLGSGVPTYSEVLLDRDHRLSFVLKRSLKDAIQADTSDLGIDRAVQMVSPEYRPSPCRWEPLPSPDSQWLVCESPPTKDARRSHTIHVNLLYGTLFVDGKPIGHNLPGKVISDSVYCELFGSHNFVVIASGLPGMDFVTMSAIQGHRVHFAVKNDNGNETVIIRTESQDTDDICELIPREKLYRDLPISLIEDHVHWLNLSTSIIEIRPIEKPWKHSSDNWRIGTFQTGQIHVTKGDKFLVDKQSPAWAMVSSRFRCLDQPGNLIITVSAASIADTTPGQLISSLRLSVALPRYDLSFFINETGDLESCDFKGMVYDEDQCVGTLFGLVNRLVLRPKTQNEVDLIPKRILIPHSYSLDLHGLEVSVKLPSSGRVGYHTYQVDNELGYLKGIMGLRSKLYLARLHVYTGLGCRPDPLTGRTGVEEAISLIWLAGTRQASASDGWLPRSRSPQIRFAWEKLQVDHTNHQEPPSDDALLREAYLFQSEVAASAQLGSLASKLLEQLLYERPAPRLPERDRLPPRDNINAGFLSFSPAPSTAADPLRQLLASLCLTNETAPPFQSQYVSRLHNSAHHCRTTDLTGSFTPRGDGWKPTTERLRKHYLQCKASYTESLNTIKMILGPKTEFERILDECGQWPRITPYILFRCLASTSPTNFKLPESWKKCLLSLALLALDVQRARRLLCFSLDDLGEELYKELENEGCDPRDAAKYPDWLLIQLQGNFLIRDVQADAAKEMISPRSGRNTVMQVNMGEGKTSVIIPICAAALANGNRLVRIIVPKALIPQTLQILTDRFCGLVDKPVYYIIFSRDHLSNSSSYLARKATRLHTIMSKCKDERGIIVMQPEHVLSLRLACVEMQLLENGIGTSFTRVVQRQSFQLKNLLHVLERSLKLLNENTYVSTVLREMRRRRYEPPGEIIKYQGAETTTHSRANLMKELQVFLDAHVRDVLDESDDVLRPHFQLIYAVGHKQPFEGSPERWIIVQQVLRLAKRHAHFLSTHDSYKIRCNSSFIGSFPQIHILQAEGGDQLTSLIAHDVLDGRLNSLELPFIDKLGLRGAIREYILRKNIHPDTVKIVEKYSRQSATRLSSLLLLRGLLAHNTLLFAFTQRRWRVDYGLDPKSPPRTMLAIPYRAKDIPAEAAEFGHPDVVILLTCLSYYYGGLSSEQLRVSFELLLQQDDPSSEYALWLEDCDTTSVPNTLRKLSGVNIRSFEQWNKYLVPLFTRNQGAIDLYLSKVVFTNHAQEFPHKIRGSYWDLAEERVHVVTGISGTSDGQYLLPISITQDDPDHLNQTGVNARVLAHLLQPENSSYMVATDENSERWTTLKLLQKIVAQNPEIRVLLDVGAQILDLSNVELAKAWLDCTPATETAGAIFFSGDNELMVLTRTGITLPLSLSPLAQQLHRCVAYLDDAHTRGTDLKFPRGFRAAVTLGPKVTKDRLVQGCMRMRQLGRGHSVMFFAPREVDQRIRGLVSKNPNVAVQTTDILHWAIHETWNDIQRQAPYWAQQGMNHKSRYEAWSHFCRNEITLKELADVWVQPDVKSLPDLYMPPRSTHTTASTKLPLQIHERCENLGVLSIRDVCMDEEQEKEVSREIQREREVTIPPKVSPAAHVLHQDVIVFVTTGVVPSPSWTSGFRHVFVPGPTTASNDLATWSPYILATTDFCETIKEDRSAQGRANDYLRPVQWVLSGKMRGKNALVLFSPFEVEQLMPEIRASKHVHLHLYIPRTTERMKPADDLRLYTVPPLPSDWIPPWTLIDQLNLFSGQVWLSDYASYLRLCRFLNIPTAEEPPERSAGMVVASNWFNDPVLTDEEIKNTFEGTPLPLAMHLLVARRGMDFAGTHMGRIIDGISLTQEDFQSFTPHTIAGESAE